MSVDHCPTCPDCGDDLVYRPEPLTSKMECEKDTGKNGSGDWQCPDCFRWFDIPEVDYDPEPEEEEK